MTREAVDPAQREIGQRAAVEVDHRELVLPVERRGRPEQAVARIVDEKRRLEIAGGQFLREEFRAVGTREVHGKDMRRAMAGGANARGIRQAAARGVPQAPPRGRSARRRGQGRPRCPMRRR